MTNSNQEGFGGAFNLWFYSFVHGWFYPQRQILTSSLTQPDRKRCQNSMIKKKHLLGKRGEKNHNSVLYLNDNHRAGFSLMATHYFFMFKFNQWINEHSCVIKMLVSLRVVVIRELYLFLVPICRCLCVVVYVIDKKWRIHWKIIPFVSPFLTTLIWICGRQARVLQVSPVHIRQVVFGQHPSRRARLCAWVRRTNTSHNITFREMNVSSLLVYLPWLFGV